MKEKIDFYPYLMKKEIFEPFVLMYQIRISHMGGILDIPIFFTPFVAEVPNHILLYGVGHKTKGVVELTYK